MPSISNTNWLLTSLANLRERLLRLLAVIRRSDTIVNLDVTIDAGPESNSSEQNTKKNIFINLSATAITLCGNGKDDWLTGQSLEAVWDCHPKLKAVTVVSVTQFPMFSNIPDSIGKLCNLSSVDFSANNLQDLPMYIVYLRKLKFLNLSDNKFLTVPPFVGHLVSLERIILTNNRLQYLPSSIINLHKLKELQVSGNRDLTSPPSDICEQGVQAVFRYIQSRPGRHNMWDKSVPNYTDAVDIMGGHFQVKSLLEMCVASVLTFDVNYFSSAYIPPPLKRHLHKLQMDQMAAVRVAKCSRCHKFFSTPARFDGHDCKV